MTPDLCPDCGLNRALVGRAHRCVPQRLRHDVANVANTPAESVADVQPEPPAVANIAPRWKRWREKHPDLYRERQRELMRKRRG